MAYSGLTFYNQNGINYSKRESQLILENVERVIMTRRGERLNDLAFGSDVSKFFFLPEFTIEDLTNEVVNSIKRCEPRVDVLDVKFSYGKEQDVVNIDLVLRIKESQEIANLMVTI